MKCYICTLVRPSTPCHGGFSLLRRSSPGFESRPCDQSRPVQTRFRCAFPYRVKRTTRVEVAGSCFNRHAVTPPLGRGASTACRRTVSGSISLPARGSFHRSLTVLFAIGHQEYLALPGGPGGFRRSFTMIDVLRMLLLSLDCRLRDSHPL